MVIDLLREQERATHSRYPFNALARYSKLDEETDNLDENQITIDTRNGRYCVVLTKMCFNGNVFFVNPRQVHEKYAGELRDRLTAKANKILTRHENQRLFFSPMEFDKRIDVPDNVSYI